MQYTLHEIPGQSIGGAAVYDVLAALDFPARRVYYIYGAKQGVERGSHAHRTLRQVLFCPYGSIRIRLDDGRRRESILLDRPGKALVLEPGLWREMDWLVKDSVLCVLASQYYDEADYIRSYDEFLRFAAQNGENGAVLENGD